MVSGNFFLALLASTAVATPIASGTATQTNDLEKRQSLSDLISKLLGGNLSLQSIANANGGKGIDLTQLVNEADKKGGEPGAAPAQRGKAAVVKRDTLQDLISQLVGGKLSIQNIANANGGKGIDLTQLVAEADKKGGEPGASTAQPAVRVKRDSLQDLISQLVGGKLSIQNIANANGGKGIDLTQLVAEADKEGGEPGVAPSAKSATGTFLLTQLLKKRQSIADLLKLITSGGSVSITQLANANNGQGFDLASLAGTSGSGTPVQSAAPAATTPEKPWWEEDWAADNPSVADLRAGKTTLAPGSIPTGKPVPKVRRL